VFLKCTEHFPQTGFTSSHFKQILSKHNKHSKEGNKTFTFLALHARQPV
jgi:glutaredoxin-related protein